MSLKNDDISYAIHNESGPSRWLITCDHASAYVPPWVNGGDLGVSGADMARHIAYDIGAKGVSLSIAQQLDAPVILSRFSRLVIDPNRGRCDPTLVMQLYDGSLIPANRGLSDEDIELRAKRLYDPYHEQYERLAARRDDCVICAVHSFTPQLSRQEPRPWQVGVLYAPEDTRLAKFVIEGCLAQGWCVGDNEPYRGDLPDDAIDQHALRAGRPNVLIEVRQDLITKPDGQLAWAQRLAQVLGTALQKSGL